MICEKSCGACRSTKLKEEPPTKFSRGFIRFKCLDCGKTTAIPTDISTSVEIKDID